MFDSSDLAKQFDSGQEVYISFQYLTREIELDINSLLVKILSRFDMGYMYDIFEPVFRELIQNAMKANMKRVWFNKMELDIRNEDDYRKGMQKFRNVAYHPELLKDNLLASRYRIVIKMRRREDGFEIDIVNNARIAPGELRRLKNRVHKALECENFTEAYENMYDATEGAGLGIILTMMLLRNSGVGAGMFRIVAEENAVRVSLAVPAELKGEEVTSVIKKRILEDVESLPTFPENIVALRSLCRNPDATIEIISDTISRDPSVTADVLKLSNSAGFITGKKITKINDAVIIIGMKNLDLILAAAASRKILEARYSRFELIWDHCIRTAYFARAIALESGHAKIAENAFVAGLLHDIGKIVLLSIDTALLNQISDLVKNRRIKTTSILEELAIGISHATIGALIAEKWNFPEELVEAIRHHHSPLGRGIRNRELVMTVYLANHMCNRESRHADLLYLEADALRKFGIADRDEYDALYRRLEGMFSKQQRFI